MKNLLIGFFLSLVVVLWTDHSQVTAHTFQRHLPNSAVKNVEKAECAALDAIQNDDASVLGYASYGTEKNFTYDIEVATFEEREDELFFVKKYSADSNLSTGILFVLTLGYFFHDLNKRLPFLKHLSLFSFDQPLYLRLRIIRI